MCMLNKRVQTLFDQEHWQLVNEAALFMNVSFGEALRQATSYAYKTKQIHKIKNTKTINKRLLAAQTINKIRKSLQLHLSVKEIREMAHYGHKY